MELDQQMFEELKSEGVELVERLDRIWMKLHASIETGLVIERPIFDELFRTFHSIKGLAELAHRNRVVSAIHLIEDRLTQIREQKSSLNSSDVDVLAKIHLALEGFAHLGFVETEDSLISELELQSQVFCAAQALNEPRVQAKVSSSPEGELLLSPAEMLLWEKYQSRSESFFILSCKGKKEDILERICPVGEILVERSLSDKHFLLFASELESSLIEAILESPVQTLRKEVHVLQSVWNAWSHGVDDLASFSPSQDSSVAKEPLLSRPIQELPIESSTESNESADPEMVKDFLDNANELLETLTQSLLELENNPSESETIETIFRAAHTIKGTAGMLGFSTIERLCHALENTFDRLRKGQLSPSARLIDQILMGWDKVRELFARLENNQPPHLPIDDYLQALLAVEKGINQPISENKVEESAHVSSDHTATAVQSNTRTDSQATIRVDLKRLDNLVNLVGELVIDRTRFARIEEAMRVRGASADLSHQMAESVLLFGRHMNEVQNIIMKVRMVPIGNVFYKFSRMVRDLSRQVGKEVDLVIDGGETELDKTLVEEIGDPMIHLIRNSVDHGIESPDEREAKGKPRKGRIRVSASQLGNTIAIAVEDDGKGLNVEKIRAKAIKNGLIGENENRSTKEIYNLIFEPGFSTAEKVTNISGRGVGMDVVKKSIQKLKGIIELDSTPEVGTKILIKLPITLAIVPSLMIEVSGECFAIPLVNVIESMRIDRGQIQQMGASQFVKVRDEVVPLIQCSDALGLSSIDADFWYRESPQNSESRSRREKMVFVVVVGVGLERVGLIVDKLIGQQEIVIKSLGSLLKENQGLAGGCVLGDGRVALVLDVLDVFSYDSVQRGLYARRASSAT